MNLEIQSRLSFYRRLEEVEHKKGISLVRHIETGQIYVEKIFSYQEAGKIQLIREYGQLLSEEYTDTGILVKARVPQEIHGKLM